MRREETQETLTATQFPGTNFCLSLLFFLAMPCSMEDLSSLTKD